jgi:hypothetical protein
MGKLVVVVLSTDDDRAVRPDFMAKGRRLLLLRSPPWGVWASGCGCGMMI